MVQQPLAWIAGSILLYALVVNAVALVKEDPPFWLIELARALYLLGIPILALLLPLALSPAEMGLRLPVRPFLSLLATLVVGTGTAAAILAAERGARGEHLLERPTQPDAHALGWSAWHALLLEAHWAFFRAAALSLSLPWLLLGNLSVRMAFALLLLGLEAFSDPALRQGLQVADSARVISRVAASALASTLLFVVTGSSLMSFLGHLLIIGLLAAYPVPEPGISPSNPNAERPAEAPRVEPTII